MVTSKLPCLAFVWKRVLVQNVSYGKECDLQENESADETNFHKNGFAQNKYDSSWHRGKLGNSEMAYILWYLKCKKTLRTCMKNWIACMQTSIVPLFHVKENSRCLHSGQNWMISYRYRLNTIFVQWNLDFLNSHFFEPPSNSLSTNC